VADQRHPAIVGKTINHDAVVAAIGTVEESTGAVHVHVCGRGSDLICRLGQRGDHLQLPQKPRRRIVGIRGHREIEFVDHVGKPAVRMEIHVARACTSRGSHLGRHVRLQPARRLIEGELRDGWPAL
jgi:hypothetical protein